MNSTETMTEKRQTPVDKPKIAAFCCYHSAYEAADAAGAGHIDIPDGIRLVRVPCTGRVDILHMLGAIEKGYDGVLVLGCHEENCKFLRGNILARKRVEYANRLLAETGAGENIVEFHGVAANQPHRFAHIVRSMYHRLKAGGAEPA